MMGGKTVIAEILEKNGVHLYAAIPVSCLEIKKPYLLRSFTGDAYAVFIAIPYYTGIKSNLAAFAAVPDYHKFANKLFSEVSGHVKEKFGREAMGFADHSPFDEIRGALACGLGVLGDNGLLITECYSSFVCIGEFVCELTVDELRAEGVPVLNEPLETESCYHCGACSRECPAFATGDKSYCLSAISQKKGELTDREISLLEKSPYVWGCDVCQLACPITKAAIAAGTIETEIGYFKNSHIEEMTLEYLDRMTDDEYAEYTFSWRKRDVMERNLRLKGYVK